jgi:hypothetical protein
LWPQAIADVRAISISEHRVLDAVRIAAIGHRFGKPPAHPELALRLTQQQQTTGCHLQIRP